MPTFECAVLSELERLLSSLFIVLACFMRRSCIYPCSESQAGGLLTVLVYRTTFIPS